MTSSVRNQAPRHGALPAAYATAARATSRLTHGRTLGVPKDRRNDAAKKAERRRPQGGARRASSME